MKAKPNKMALLMLCVVFAFSACGAGGKTQAVLGAPAVTGGNKKLLVRWDAVPDAIAYEVWCNTANDPASATRQGSDVSATKYTITGLTNGTLYYVWVKVKYPDEKFKFSAVASGTPGILPGVATTAIKGNLALTLLLTGTSAKGGGTVITQGDSGVSERGLCWNTTGKPTTSDSKVPCGKGTGVFTNCALTELAPGTTYFVRAYATNDTGTAYSNEISFNSGKIIGSDYAGGYVFYNDGSGHGLVAAKSDLSAAKAWIIGDPAQTMLNGNTLSSLGSGRANTTAIMNQLGHTDSAARLCTEYKGDGYGDWFLPSKDELNLMYTKLKLAGIGNFADHYYWSSSEGNSLNAWYQTFTNGSQGNGGKDITDRVRAIRAF